MISKIKGSKLHVEATYKKVILDILWTVCQSYFNSKHDKVQPTIKTLGVYLKFFTIHMYSAVGELFFFLLSISPSHFLCPFLFF